jgi:hypothetical protein
MAGKRLEAVSESELSRLEDSSIENATLAKAWDRDDVIFVTLLYAAPKNTLPYVTVQIMQRNIGAPLKYPRLDPIPERGYHISIDHYNKLVYRRLVKGEASWSAPYEHLRSPPKTARERLDEIFKDLQRLYTTVCVVSLKVRQSLLSLKEIGFSLPKNVVTVDLIKVLEYQTMDGLSQVDMTYLKESVHVDGKRYELKSALAPGGWSQPVLTASKLLVMLGPRAEEQRRAKKFERLKRERVNLKRIASKIRPRDIKEMKIMARQRADHEDIRDELGLHS